MRFRETIERGLKILDEEIVGDARAAEDASSAATTAFKLYDTFGFPLDLTQVIAQERGFTVDEAGYEQALEEQRARSEGSKVGEEAVDARVARRCSSAVAEGAPAGVKFVGYEREEGEGTVVAIVKDGAARRPRDRRATRSIVVTDVTPFYGESGGQVGDRGVIETRGRRADALRGARHAEAARRAHRASRAR